jgi:hypothetical protein
LAYVYQPTNAGWGAAATLAKKKKAAAPIPPPVFAAPNAPGVPQAPRGPVYRENPYAGLLASYASQARADSQAQSVADAASRDAAIKRFLVSYGDVPDFASMGVSDAAKGILGGLGGDIRALAQKNTAEGTSVKARLDQKNALAQRRIPATLAGRGLLRSGQTGADLSEQAMQNKQANFDVLNEMLGNIEGTVSQFAQAEAARARALADAELQAAMAAQGDYGGDIYGDDYSFDPFTNQQNPNILNGWAQAAAAQNAAMARYTPPKKKAPAKRVVKTQVGRAPARRSGI